MTATITPTWHHHRMSPQGQPMEELVNGLADGVVPGSPLSIGAVSMPPGHVANIHEHRNTWIFIYIVDSGPEGVCTLYGPNLEYETINRPGDILVIRPREAHGAVNLSLTHSVHAIEIRTSSTVYEDNHVLEHLQLLAEQRRPMRSPTRRVAASWRDRLLRVSRACFLRTLTMPAMVLPRSGPPSKKVSVHTRLVSGTEQANRLSSIRVGTRRPMGADSIAMDWSQSYHDPAGLTQSARLSEQCSTPADNSELPQDNLAALLETTAALVARVTELVHSTKT